MKKIITFFGTIVLILWTTTSISKPVIATTCTFTRTRDNTKNLDWFTINSGDCVFLQTIDGVDAGTGSSNSGILKIPSGTDLTVDANQTLAVGQVKIDNGGKIILVDSGQIKVGNALFLTDADNDGYVSSGTLSLTGSDGKIRAGSLSRGDLDCNDSLSGNMCTLGATPSANWYFRSRDDLSFGAIASWRLDEPSDNSCSGGEDACDSSDFAHHGTATGTIITDEPEFGKVREFNGTTDVLSFGNNVLGAMSGNFSLSAWVKTNTATGDQTVLGERKDGTCVDGWFGVKAGKAAYADGVSSFSGSVNVSDNLWHSIVYVYDGVSGKIYVDGTLDVTSLANATWRNTCADQDVTIGRSEGDTANGFSGKIARVGVWNRNLTPQEIDALSKKSPSFETSIEAPPLDPTTVLYLHMDESANDTCLDSKDACDSSGKGNHASATGTSITAGAMKNGRLFSGSSSHILTVADSTDFTFGSQDFTISVWLNPSVTSGNYEGIASTYNGSSGFILTTSYGTNGHFAVWDPQFGWWDTNASATIGVWQNLTVVRTGLTYIVYKNGREVARKLYSPTGSIDGGNLILGGWNGSYAYYTGLMDEFIVYRRALSPEEVAGLGKRRPFGKVDTQVLDMGTSLSSVPIRWNTLLSSTSDGETPFSSTDLVAQWNFNATSGTTVANNAGEGTCQGTASDCDGTLTGVADTTGQDKTPNSGWTAINNRFGTGGMMFDGSNDWVAITNSKVIPQGAKTISFWMKTSSTTANQVIMSNNNGTTTAYGITMIMNNNTANKLRIFHTRNSADVFNYDLYSNTNLNDGNWHYVVHTWDGATGTKNARIYVDGVLDNTADVANATQGVAAANLVIGASSYASSRLPYLGLLDAIQVYSRVLSDAEIWANYQAGKSEVMWRAGSTASPDSTDTAAGTNWTRWAPIDHETSIDSLDSSVANWLWDQNWDVEGSAWQSGSLSTNLPKSKTNDTNVKVEGTGSMKITVGKLATDAYTAGLWHLDETDSTATSIKDSSANANHSSALSGTSVVDGISQKARLFNGSSDVITVSDAASLDGSAMMSWEAWYKPNNTNDSSLIYKRIGEGEYAQYALVVSSGSIACLQSADGSTWGTNVSATAPTAGVWHHVACTNDGNIARLYIDGAMTATDTTPATTLAASTEALLFGKGRVGGAYVYLNGTMDEIRVSSQARSAEEISEEYRLGIGHRLGISVSSLDLSEKTTLPFFIASDVKGAVLSLDIGETAYDTGEPDSDTLALWHLDETGGGSSYLSSDGTKAYSSSEFSGSFLDNYAFDNNTGTNWYSAAQSSAVTQWIAYKFSSATLVDRIALYPNSSYLGLVLKNFTISASTDSTNGSDGNWTTLASGLSMRGVAQWDEFNLNNTTPYTWYKLSGPAQLLPANGYYYLSVAEIQMHKALPKLEDASENNHFAVLSGGNSGSNGTGIVGRSYTGFTSSQIPRSDNVTLANNATVTAEAWIAPSISGTFTNSNSILSFGEQGTNYGWVLGFGTSSYQNYPFFYSNTGSFQYTPAPALLGQWHHIAGTINGSGTKKLFVDGQELASAGSAGYTGQTIPFTIGRFYYNYDGYYFAGSGNIDEVRVSNAVRTGDQIRRSYEYGLGKRSHAVIVEFKASLGSNLITDQNDLSFDINEMTYGSGKKADHLFIGDKIIIRETIAGTEYLTQGTVSSVHADTGAVTVSGWDINSFPSGGYTANATVFKWQREWFDLGKIDRTSDRDAITRITLRFTQQNAAPTIYLDDIRSNSGYLTTAAGETLSISPAKRYLQLRTILTAPLGHAVSPALSSFSYNPTPGPTLTPYPTLVP